MTDHACPECRARAAAPPDPDGERTRARAGSLDEVLREGLRTVYGRLRAQGIVQRRWVERVRARRVEAGRPAAWAEGIPSKLVLAGSPIGVTVDRLDDLQQAGVAEPDEVIAAGLGEPCMLELAPAVLVLLGELDIEDDIEDLYVFDGMGIPLLIEDVHAREALRQLARVRPGLERAAARALRLANSRAELAALGAREVER